MEERTAHQTTLASSTTAETVSLSSPAETAAKPVNRKALIVAIVVAVVILALLVLAIVFLAADPARTANIRDIVIILFAFASLIISICIGVLLVVLLYRLQELISFLRGEIVPMLTNIQQTVNTVRGTTTFVSDNVAKPTIKVAGVVAGVQQMAKAANAKVRGKVGH